MDVNVARDMYLKSYINPVSVFAAENSIKDAINCGYSYVCIETTEAVASILRARGFDVEKLDHFADDEIRIQVSGWADL